MTDNVTDEIVPAVRQILVLIMKCVPNLNSMKRSHNSGLQVMFVQENYF